MDELADLDVHEATPVLDGDGDLIGLCAQDDDGTALRPVATMPSVATTAPTTVPATTPTTAATTTTASTTTTTTTSTVPSTTTPSTTAAGGPAGTVSGVGDASGAPG
jgi:hypothetical protein